MENSSRRQFLEKSTTALVAGAVMTTFATTEVEAERKADAPLSFVHHVFFWLKDPKNKKDYDKLLAGLKGLGKIELIKMSHIGLPSVNNFELYLSSFKSICSLYQFKSAARAVEVSFTVKRKAFLAEEMTSLRCASGVLAS